MTLYVLSVSQDQTANISFPEEHLFQPKNSKETNGLNQKPDTYTVLKWGAFEFKTNFLWDISPDKFQLWYQLFLFDNGMS